MKDYSLGQNEQFILGCYRDGNDLVIRYEKRSVRVPYSMETEKSILFQMECQVKNYQLENEQSDLNRKYGKLDARRGVFGFIGVFFLSVVIPMLACEVPLIPTLTVSVGLGASLLMVGHASFKLKKLEKIYEDYNKSKLFLENKRNLTKVSTLGEAKKQTLIEPIPAVNINSIDKMSLEALKNLIQTVNQSQETKGTVDKQKVFVSMPQK